MAADIRKTKLFERYGADKIHSALIRHKATPATKAATAPSAQDLLNQLIAEADRGDANAQYKLANKYAHGDGVAKNDKIAFHYFKLAADRGHKEAKYEVGYRYSNGIGIDRDMPSM